MYRVLCLVWVLAGCASNLALERTRALLEAPAWPETAVADAPALNTDELAWTIHEAVNRVRQEHGVAALDWADGLGRIATGHSRDMAQHPFFGHVSPVGSAPLDRARTAGLPVHLDGAAFLMEGIGENLFLTHRYAAYYVIEDPGDVHRFEFEWKTVADLADEAVALWMASPAHRENLLSPLYRTAGVGVVHTEHETLFVTHNFAAIALDRFASL